jgi:P-loop Domain of unknown function (DUF2791)
MQEITQKEARKIINSIGASGIPPDKGVSHYNVGNESLLDTFRDEYFDAFLNDGGAAFKLVVGDYGAGKSHFLYCLRDLAWSREFVVSRTELSAKQCPYDDQLKVYQEIARNIIWHMDDPDVQDDRGLDLFLENHFHKTCATLGVESAFDGLKMDPKLSGWLQRMKRMDVEFPSFKYAVQGFFEAVARKDEHRQMMLGAYLRGEPVKPKDTQTDGVTEKMDKSNAFRALRSLCQTIRALGYAGTVLLFDEGDRMVSIGSSRQEKIACDNLREVIDSCAGEKLPGALFVYAVPPRFVTDTAQKYPALAQRVGGAHTFSRVNHLSTIINLEKLDLPGEELLRQIGLRLLTVYEAAYQHEFDRKRQQRNIDLIAKEMSSLLSDSHRRQFVKVLVNFLNEQRVAGERDYDQQRVDEEIRRVDDELEGRGSVGVSSRDEY